MKIPPTTQPTGSPTESTIPPIPIALRRGTEIGGHGIGARGNAPDEHGLAEIPGLLRQSGWSSDVEQAAKAEDAIEDEPADGNARGVQAPLQDVIGEDARLFQVRVQILEAVPDLPWHRLNDRRRRIEHHLIEVKHAAIELLVGIIDWQATRRGARPRRRSTSAARLAALNHLVHRSTPRMRRQFLSKFRKTRKFSPQVQKGPCFENVCSGSEKSDPAPTQTSRAAPLGLSPFCHSTAICTLVALITCRDGICSAWPKEQAGTAPRPRASSPATKPSACPCSTCPDGAKTTGCRRRWRSCRR